MKTYRVTYFIKAGQHRGCEAKETMTVEAANGKAACAACVEQVKQRTGRHAFRPHAQPVNV